MGVRYWWKYFKVCFKCEIIFIISGSERVYEKEFCKLDRILEYRELFVGW